MAAQKAVYAMMKPGVSWPSCHEVAEKEILKGLLKMGLLQNGDIDDFVQVHLGAIFFPHGLGHLIGCDTHDVGGYIKGTPTRPTRPGIQKLRTARVLEMGMMLTVEPGCYFIDYLIDEALNSIEQVKYINKNMLESLRGFGGVRLEDDVVVTADGIENYTTCPRLIEEIESVMSGGSWPPSVDNAPYLFRQWCHLSSDGTKMENLHIPISS